MYNIILENEVKLKPRNTENYAQSTEKGQWYFVVSIHSYTRKLRPDDILYIVK